MQRCGSASAARVLIFHREPAAPRSARPSSAGHSATGPLAGARPARRTRGWALFQASPPSRLQAGPQKRGVLSLGMAGWGSASVDSPPRSRLSGWSPSAQSWRGEEGPCWWLAGPTTVSGWGTPCRPLPFPGTRVSARRQGAGSHLPSLPQRAYVSVAYCPQHPVRDAGPPPPSQISTRCCRARWGTLNQRTQNLPGGGGGECP